MATATQREAEKHADSVKSDPLAALGFLFSDKKPKPKATIVPTAKLPSSPPSSPWPRPPKYHPDPRLVPHPKPQKKMLLLQQAGGPKSGGPPRQ